MPLRLWGRNEENRAAICGFYRSDGRLCDCSSLLHFEVLMTTIFYLTLVVAGAVGIGGRAFLDLVAKALTQVLEPGENNGNR